MAAQAHLPKVTPVRTSAAENGSVPKIDIGLAATRRVFGMLIAGVLVLAAGAFDSAPPAMSVSRFAIVIPGPPNGEPAEPAVDRGRCADPAGTWLGMRWRTEL